jgi:hypothetical protein
VNAVSVAGNIIVGTTNVEDAISSTFNKANSANIIAVAAFAAANSAAGGVSSFNTRTGAVTLNSGDVTGALGFTPSASGHGHAISDVTNLQTTLDAKYSASNPPPASGVADVRLGTEASAAASGFNATHKAPVGNSLTGVTTGTDYVSPPLATIFYKPIQKLVSGVWTTVSG